MISKASQPTYTPYGLDWQNEGCLNYLKNVQLDLHYEYLPETLELGNQYR